VPHFAYDALLGQPKGYPGHRSAGGTQDRVAKKAKYGVDRAAALIAQSFYQKRLDAI
jgi:hypothetical protein